MAAATCPACGGRAAIANAITGSPETCPICGGTGQVAVGTDDLPFWYPFLLSPYGSNPTLTIAAANGTVNALVQIANDSDFMWDRNLFTSTGGFNVYLKDEFTARPLMPFQNTLISSGNAGGTGQLPFWLPKAYLLRRTSTVSAIFTDTSGNPGNVIQFVLFGYKVS
jgi:hypothetical protein